MTVRGINTELYKRIAILAVQRDEDISVLVNQALERFLIVEESKRDIYGRK